MKSYLGYNSKRNRDIFLICWLAYSATYICRLNFSSVIPELTADGVFSESKIASISSAFFICYGLGQIISGIIGDRINAKYLVFCGVLFSALSNILIFFFHSYYALLTLWALNGLFQSLVWSPLLKVASLEYDENLQSKFGIHMSTTVPLGTVLSYAVSLVTLRFCRWNYVFLTCGVILAFVSLLWFFETQRLHLKSVKTSEHKNISLKKSTKILATSGVLLFVIPIIAQGTLKDSVTQWVPEFFSSQFNSSVSFSLALTMALPIVNVTGAFMAKALNVRLKSEAKTSALFFAISLAFLAMLYFTSGKSLVLSLIAMVGVTNCMFAINVMLITLVPLKFTKYGIVSTVAGILNATAYIGCAIANQIAGGLLQYATWSALIVFWMCLAVVAIVFCILTAKSKFK